MHSSSVVVVLVYIPGTNLNYFRPSPGRRCSHRGETVDGARAAEKELRRPPQAMVRNPESNRSPLGRQNFPSLAEPSRAEPCPALPNLAEPRLASCLFLHFLTRSLASPRLVIFPFLLWMGQVCPVQGKEHAHVGARADPKVEGSSPCGRSEAEGQYSGNAIVAAVAAVAAKHLAGGRGGVLMSCLAVVV